MARIFHIATVSDWEAAQESGSYTTSTRGRTLAEEGFIHASRADQWPAVRTRYYADVVDPLLLLVIDTDLLDVPLVEEEVPGGDTFPHLYGPLTPAAVVQAVPLETAVAGAMRSFSSLFLAEMFRNAMLGVLLVGLALAGTLGGRWLDATWGSWLGLLLGSVVGIVVVTFLGRLGRRREPVQPGSS